MHKSTNQHDRNKESISLVLSDDQQKRQLELQRLAEFGRLSASLIHEISTPIMAAALTLDEMGSDQPSSLIKQARQDIRQLELYVTAAKKQLTGESAKTNFSMTVAIHQITMLLSSRAKLNNIKILVNTKSRVRLYGDLVKFHQLLANLINNAIEAYDISHEGQRIVRVSVELKGPKMAIIKVSDKGSGISSLDKKHIFEPFYTTKYGQDRGLGLGLATVKQYVEQEFGGKITVTSNTDNGTTFKITLPIITVHTA